MVQKFSSFAEAEAADKAYYRSLTPEQRLEIVFDLIARQRTQEGLNQPMARVVRIISRRTGLPK